MPEFYMILDRKIIQIRKFYDIYWENLKKKLKNEEIYIIFARKMSDFYWNYKNYQKNMFPHFFGGYAPLCPPTSYTYDDKLTCFNGVQCICGQLQ